MMSEMMYRAYGGNEPFILLKYGEPDEKLATEIVNRLIERQFRVCYSGMDAVDIAEAEHLATRMLSAKLIIFLISVKATESSAFRSAINFALSRKKELFCILLDDEPLTHGLELQLKRTPKVHLSAYDSEEDLCQNVVTDAPFTQNLRGEDAKVKADQNRTKKKVLLASLIALAFLIIAGIGIAGYRIHYENSLSGQIERITATEYLDLSGEDATLLDQLEGKTVRVLIARNMGLTDVEALSAVQCEELDLSQNPKINTLEPLLSNESLQIVTVSQDMYPAINRISGRHAFRIVIGE